MKNRILIKGKPGIGKTTTIIKASAIFSNKYFQGFYTQEVKLNNKRIGFDIINFNNDKAILARKNIHTPYQVGNYNIDIISFEKIAIPALIPRIETKLFIIDEIGKMECFSIKFINYLINIFNSNYPIIATIPIYPLPIINKIISNYKVEIIELNLKNRNEIPLKLVNFIDTIINTQNKN